MADIISTLPDAILCHILSFLQTKHAVTTGILSKRWIHLWTSVPVLNFSHTTVTDATANFRFNNSVFSSLLSRNPTHSIQSFHLEVTYDYPECNIDNIAKWINFVVERRVEYLCLHVHALYFPKFPFTIVTCRTLVVLKLFCFSLEYGFSSVVLPSLKTLHLHIWFSNHRDFMMFLSGCPILEDLLTIDLYFDYDESLTCDELKSFCLTNLTRADIDLARCNILLKAVHNVHSLRFEIDNKVQYHNDLIPTFHNLTQLEIISLDYSWRFLVEVLNHCPKLQKLDIDQADSDEKTWTRKDDKENWVNPDVVPQCLSLHLRTCNLFNFLGLQGELLLARYILMKAKVLQTMKVRNVGQTQIKRLISSCPRASTMCKVIICQRVNVSSYSILPVIRLASTM